MQHESLERFILEKKVQALLVFLGAQSCGHQGLRLAAREKRRAVNARKHAYLASDLPDGVKRTPIGTPPANQHVVAEDAFAEPLERAVRQLLLIRVVCGRPAKISSLMPSTSP